MGRVLRAIGRILMPWHDPDDEAKAAVRFEVKMQQGARIAERLERNFLLEAFPRVGSRQAQRIIRRDARSGDARIRGLGQ